jgi:hypothetical protein
VPWASYQACRNSDFILPTSTRLGHSALQALHSRQRSKTSKTSWLVRPPGMPPAIASRSTLARPRVLWVSSRVAMNDGHIVPTPSLRQAPTPVQASAAPSSPSGPEVEHGGQRDRPGSRRRSAGSRSSAARRRSCRGSTRRSGRTPASPRGRPRRACRRRARGSSRSGSARRRARPTRSRRSAGPGEGLVGDGAVGGDAGGVLRSSSGRMWSTPTEA